jgi:hypothetical protein
MTNSASLPAAARRRHAGPPLGPVAAAYTLLFLAGLYPVTIFGGLPHFPGPWESPDTIAAFFGARGDAVRLCASLQFGAAIPLGIFTATVVSRLQFLGVRAAGTWIALFGGLAASFTMIAASSALWAMAQPAVANEPGVIQGFYWLVQALGGSGFSVPFGLLIAGVSVPAALGRLLPKWIVVLGFVLAVCAELSWLYLLVPQTLPLVPLTRFPGFIWMIAVGLTLPNSIERQSQTAMGA